VFTRSIEELTAYMTANGHSDIKELIGAVKDN